jgi:hypothetical protein
MIALQEVEAQLHQLGIRFRFWGRAEMLELQHILIPGEQINSCLNGRYEGGFAMLCATDQRLLLVDKKPFYLTVEDVRYDMVAEVDFHNRLVDSTIRVRTPGKALRFTAFRHKSLRQITTYIQQRVMEIRQQYQGQMPSVVQQEVSAQSRTPQAVPVRQPAPAVFETSATTIGQMATDGFAEVANSHGKLRQSLPLPRSMNPYTRTPLLMRRRVSRFGA